MTAQLPAQQYQQAVQAMQNGQWQTAAVLLEQVIAARPQVPECHLTLGLAYENLGQIDRAIAALGQAITLNPDLHEALEAYGRCLDRQPDAAEGYSAMGIAFAEVKRFAQAEAYFRRALSRNPNHAMAHNNLGLLLDGCGRHQEALLHLQQAVALRPDYANAQWNLGLSLLRLGQFQAGWEKLAWRNRADLAAILESQRQAGPAWDGSPFPDKTLLVRYEQGIGDTIQFVRYLPRVKARGGTVLIEIPDALQDLFTSARGVDRCVPAAPDGIPTVGHDAFVFIMDLPGIFQTTLDNIPGQTPYLQAPADKIDLWRDTFDSNHFNVGLVWAGSPRHTNDAQRSCPLQHWKPLWDVPGIRWFSLQKGSAAQALSPGSRIQDLSDRLHTWGDTAAAMTHLDLLISVDTAALHLAGALHRPAWGLLPFEPDWRWLLDRSDSPWYPSLQLFRQDRPDDWAGVFDRVKMSLLNTLTVTLEL